jgi:hypothetical protein
MTWEINRVYQRILARKRSEDDRGGDLSENFGVLRNVGIWDCEAGGAKRPPARPQAERGKGAGRVAPPADGVRGVTLGKIFKLHMAADAF